MVRFPKGFFSLWEILKEVKLQLLHSVQVSWQSKFWFEQFQFSGKDHCVWTWENCTLWFFLVFLLITEFPKEIDFRGFLLNLFFHKKMRRRNSYQLAETWVIKRKTDFQLIFPMKHVLHSFQPQSRFFLTNLTEKLFLCRSPMCDLGGLTWYQLTNHDFVSDSHCLQGTIIWQPIVKAEGI